jgi:hypothetical protein
MKKIIAKDKRIILIDNKDYKIFSKYDWFVGKRFIYAGRTHNYKIKNIWHSDIYFMHNEIMGKKKGYLIDHINRNTLDNRRCNLRFATLSENQMNSGIQKNNTTGYKGVSYCKRDKAFRASISFKGEKYDLGRFDTTKEAAIAYNKKAKELTPFAYLNKI